MTPYFSIILPVYNVEKYLKRCVRSVLEQQFSDYEIILVNDGSTDSSGQLCDSLSREYPGIHVIHKENGGLSSARNVGMEAACGQYIWFVDSDDWIDAGSLQKIYELTCRENPDVVKFNCIRHTGEQRKVSSNARPGIYNQQEISQILLNQAFYSAGKYILSACMHVYKREFIRQQGIVFVSERLVGSEDYLFNLEVMAQVHRVCVMEDGLYHYELREGSLTQRYKKDLPARYEQLYIHLLERLPQEYHGKIAAFYLWHLLRGTCIPNEYYTSEEDTMAQRRKRVKEMMKTDTVRRAYRSCEKTGFSRKQRLVVQAVGHGREPLFYWLYVVKPNIKKGKIHET